MTSLVRRKAKAPEAESGTATRANGTYDTIVRDFVALDGNGNGKRKASDAFDAPAYQDTDDAVKKVKVAGPTEGGA